MKHILPTLLIALAVLVAQASTPEHKTSNYMETNVIKLTVNGGKTFTATLVDNSSTQALIELLEKGSIQYLCNMFVMNRELFMQYSEFCFSVLQTADKIIPKDEIYRTMGFLGEFCLSIFVFKLKKNKNIRIKELNAAFILSDNEIKYPKGKYFYYWLMSKISWGEKRQQYKQKRKSLKSMLKFLKNGQ